MLIKSGKDAFAEQIKRIMKARFDAIISRKKLAIYLLALIAFLAVFVAGAFTYRSVAGYVAQNTFLMGLREVGESVTIRDIISIETVRNYIKGRLSEPERINIDIGFTDYQQLAERRKLALENQTLYGIENDWINAEIRYKTDTIPVRLRLKGGGTEEHLAGSRWSLRVETRDNKALFGMTEFSLMDPQRRGFLLEWLFRRVMREEGVISKRYEFIEVIINGENKGVYAIDEHYGKTMIEASQRREGLVVRFAQERLWFERAAFYLYPFQFDDYYFTADVDAIDSGRIKRDELLSRQLEKTANLLEAFRNGDLPTHEVFDVDKLAKFMAVGDVIGAYHGFGIFNMKFYYNPITSKLEPVIDDNFNETDFKPGRRLFRLQDAYNKGAFLKQIFRDLVFVEKYIQELERVSEKSYVDNILSELDDEITRNLEILYRDYPSYRFPRDQLYENRASLCVILNPHRGIKAYFQQKLADSIILGIATCKALPMEILSVTDGSNTLFPKQGRTILAGKDYASPVVYEEIEFNLPDGIDWAESIPELKVNYKILGTNRLRSESVIPYPSFNQQFLTSDFIRQEPNFDDFLFLRVDSSRDEIRVERGSWVLNQNLIIPEGYTFIVNAGTNLDLTNSAKILSYSPITFVGLEDSPITISSSDSTGQGIVVLSSGGKSILENVIFTNLSAPSQNGWELTGAITFYESPVYISKCRFLENRAEDALNLIRSEFNIEDSLFKNSLSDALDADFSNGYISRTSFIDSGNDAIDFSWSVVEISKCYIDGAGDKGLSVGESSKVSVNQIEIKNTKIAAASKDMSELTIVKINIYDSEIGLAAYQKKPEFGPAHISATNVNSMNVPVLHLIEEKSVLMLEDIRIDGTEKDVAKGVDKD